MASGSGSASEAATDTVANAVGGAAGGATKGGLGAALAASRFLRLRKRKEKYFGVEEGVEATGGGGVGGAGGGAGAGADGRGEDGKKDEEKEKDEKDEGGKSIWDREYGEPLVSTDFTLRVRVNKVSKPSKIKFDNVIQIIEGTF